MTRTITVAPVRKSVVVKVDAARAFDIFTGGVDRWWPKEPCDGAPRLAQMIIEPFKGGRWYARHEDGSEAKVGQVLAWEPGRRAVFSWEYGAKSTPAAGATSEVEVKFIAEGPAATRVELEHRGFERLGKEGGEALRKDVDGGWAAALDSYAKDVAGGAS